MGPIPKPSYSPQNIMSVFNADRMHMLMMCGMNRLSCQNWVSWRNAISAASDARGAKYERVRSSPWRREANAELFFWRLVSTKTTRSMPKCRTFGFRLV